MSDTLYDIPNYGLVRQDRSISRGGGVCWYVHNKYRFKVINLEPINNIQLEQLWISVRIKNYKYGFGVVYVPPATDMSFLEDLDNTLCQINTEVDKVVLVGDFNIDLLKTTRQSTKLINLLATYSLIQVVSQPTRITATSQTLLDVICLSEDIEHEPCKEVDLLNMTDHLLVECRLAIRTTPKKPNITVYRDFSHFIAADFARDAMRMDWNRVLDLADVDEKVDFFNSAISSLFDFYAPLKSKTIKKQRHPYITFAITKLIQLKKKAKSKYLKTKNLMDYAQYRSLRNYTANAINQEKRAYLNYEINRNKNNPKKLWKNLDKLNIHNKCRNYIPEDRFDGNMLNDFFINVGGPGQIDEAYIDYFNTNMKERTDPLQFSEVTPEDVKDVLKTLKSDAVGADSISLKFLKIVTPYCVDILTHILNYSLAKAQVPRLWKKSVIIPFSKTATPEHPSDLRPISILPTVSKILEKIVLKQIVNHVNKHILPSTQSGFRPGHSTSTALLKITNDITHAMDNSKVTFLILIDFSKAFDTIHHELLLSKLHFYGFSNGIIQWFRSYLSARTQVVQLHGQFSDEREILKGVPQGSILGPLLFTIYTANMSEILNNTCCFHQYADDTQIYQSCSASDVNETIENLNNNLQEIFRWSTNSGLKINPTKTTAVCLGTSVLRARALSLLSTDLLMNGTVIEFTPSAKNLGVCFDANLNFEGHVNKLLSVSYCKLKSIYKFKSFINCDVKWNLCNALILSRLNYCSPVYYSFLTNEYAHKLQKVQNCCLRFSYNINYRDHVTPHFNHLNILKNENVFLMQYMQLLYNILKSNNPKYLSEMLIKRCDIHQRDTRSSQLYTIPQHNTAKFKNCFTYKAAEILNKYHSLYISSQTSTSFKRTLKSMLLNV